MSGARSAASSTTQRWSISKAVRNTDFSSSFKRVEVLHRALVRQDGLPGVLAVQALGRQ